MISIKIDGSVIAVEMGTELLRDGTEDFDFGRIIIPKSTRRLGYPDFAEVEVIINSITYETVIQKDRVERLSVGKYKHTITLGEVVLKFSKIFPPDRKFTTKDGDKVTWLYHLQEILASTYYGRTNPYTIASSTQTLLDVDADEKEYSGGSLLENIVDIFRAVGAVPVLTLSNIIKHQLINGKGNEIASLEDEQGEVLETDIGDYALSVQSKVKNGTYEANLIVGGTYFPAKDQGATPRSANTKYKDDESEWHIDSGIRRMIQMRIINLDSHEGDFRIKNAGVRYLNSAVPVIGEQALDVLIKSYWFALNGSDAEYKNQTLKEIEIEWYYQAIRDSELKQERHSLGRVTKESTLLNNQKDSTLELGRYGAANKQLINRTGNYSYEKTIRYYDKNSPVFHDLNDYLTDGYKISKIKYLVRHTSYDVTYKFVDKQSILNPITSVNSKVSPFTISKKNVLTNPIYNQYIEFVRTKGTDNAYTNGALKFREVLFNMLNFSTGNDTPLYNCQYSSSDSDTTSDNINMSVQRTPFGNSFNFNAQFQSPRLAGYQLVSDIGFLGSRLKPYGYANPNGQVENCRFRFGSAPTIDSDLHPVGAYDSNWLAEIPQVEYNLNPDEKLGITLAYHCVSNIEGLIIGDLFVKNNSLIKELGVTQGHTIVYYPTNPYYTTDDKYLKGGGTGNGTIIVNTVDYENITIGSIPAGYSWAWVKTTTNELYMAYNNTGTDLNIIYNDLKRTRTDTETL